MSHTAVHSLKEPFITEINVFAGNTSYISKQINVMTNTYITHIVVPRSCDLRQFLFSFPVCWRTLSNCFLEYKIKVIPIYYSINDLQEFINLGMLKMKYIEFCFKPRETTEHPSLTKLKATQSSPLIIYCCKIHNQLMKKIVALQNCTPVSSLAQ